MLSINHFSSSIKRTAHHEDDALLHLTKKSKTNEGDRFLEEYPSTIFPNYELLLKNTDHELVYDELITENEVKDFAMAYLVRLWKRKGNFTCRNREVLKTCIALAVDYDFKGFKKFQRDWHCRSYGKGTLETIRRLDVVQNESVIVECVGEERDVITPSKEVEEVICKFVKSVATIETWRTKNDFVDAWNDKYFQGVRENSIKRYVCLGWKRNCYVGWDWCSEDGKVVERRQFVMLDSVKIGRYWDEAWDCVRAQLIIDALLKWAFDGVKTGWTQKAYEINRPLTWVSIRGYFKV